MKAIVYTAYGTPDVLHLMEVEQPIPKDNEVLIKIHAAVVAPSDTAFRKGEPFIIRMIYGISKPKIKTQGVEFSGVVAGIGNGVKQFNVGDAVAGMSPDKFGAHAEYLCLAETKLLVSKPASATDAEAVGILDGAPTAMTFLSDVGKLQRGQRVLINGASGAVGTAAVQLAKHFGAHVTAVCSAANAELVASLGAHEVIDYTREDFTQNGKTYDLIFDAIGKRSFGQCQRSLTARGVYMTTVPTLGMVFDLLRTLVGGKKAKFATAGLIQSKDSLNALMRLFEDGKLKAVIDRRYPLAQTAEAHRYVESERKKGNVVIIVAGEA